MLLNKKQLILLSVMCLAIFPLQAQVSNEIAKMSLKQCIDYGLKHHPSVRIARNATAKSNQQAKELLSQYLPQINANAGIDDNIKLQQTIIPEGTFGPGTPEQRVAFGTQWNSSMIVQADQTILNVSLLTGLKANKPNIELAKVNEEENNQNIIYSIANAYYQIIVTQKQLELLQTNKIQFEKILKVTELQAEQGVAKKVDVKQVQVNLNNVLSAISIAENNLKLAENTLKNYMGFPQDVALKITDADNWIKSDVVLKEEVEFDFSQTIGFKQQNLQISLYEINKKRIFNQIYPTISAYGRYGALGFGQEFQKAFDPLLDFSVVGVKLSWQLFTGLHRDAQYRMANIDLLNAKENLRLSEELTGLRFQNAKLQLNRAKNNISNNKENMELAKEVYDNTTLQYNNGVANLSQLLNAELSYREAQNIYINAMLEYYLADLEIQRTNGTLSEFYNAIEK